MKGSSVLGIHWILAVAAVATAGEKECTGFCEDVKTVASSRSACRMFRDAVQRPQLGRVLSRCRWGFKAAIDTYCDDACVNANGGDVRLEPWVQRVGEACPGALSGAWQSLLREACVQGYRSGVEDLTALLASPTTAWASQGGANPSRVANSSEAEGAAKDGEPVMRQYSSFAEFASDQAKNRNEQLPVPVVISRSSNSSIPLAIIIGVQKGGTQNLRDHLTTHPLLSGMQGDEAHFFDRQWYPTVRNQRGEWRGSGGGDQHLSTFSVGQVLSAYSKKVMESVMPSARNSTVTVDSTPAYIFCPLAPYRIKLVLPRAKFILILRDPTERYYSQLRMTMCRAESDETLEDVERRRNDLFHTPGQAASYLAHGEENYMPYTAVCRGEGATHKDLRRCWYSMQQLNPLHRGLYADQLERWFLVFDRSQILILEASEMSEDFAGTLDKVASHVGLPAHEFKYDSRFRHESMCDDDRPDLFAAGGRYDRMLEDARLFREWYRPHNQRLFELLGRAMPWE